MANDTAFRAGRFLQGQVTQDFSGCGPGNPPGAAAGPGAAVTATIECNPSAIDACPTMRGCQTQPPTALCTPVPEFCPTFCGPECQTPQPNCTSINCTQAGPQCPPQTIPPQCPIGSNPILDCTFGCTQFGPACPQTPFPQCGTVTTDPSCQTVNVQPQAVGAVAGGAQITLLTIPVWACGPTPATRCFICPPMTYDYNCNIQQRAGGAVGAAAVPGTWPTPQTRCFVCDQQAARAAMPNTAATVCTQYGPGCHTYPNGDCTFFGCGPGGGGGQTAATVCTQFGHQCQSAVDACPTRLCGGGGAVGAAAGGGPAPTVGFCVPRTMTLNCRPRTMAACPTMLGCGLEGAQQQPSAVDACPTRIGCNTYPNGDCTFFGCGPGGGGGQTAATVCTQFGHQCRSAVDACPTRLCGQQAVGTWPTPATRCFIC